jgi:hypothetical protein
MTSFTPTTGPSAGKTFTSEASSAYAPVHGERPYLGQVEIGGYRLDHVAGTATWEVGEYYDPAVHDGVFPTFAPENSPVDPSPEDA